MSLESATGIWGLTRTNPDGADAKSDGDGHLRLIKGALLDTFPAVGATVTASHTELNYVDGVTSAIQTQLDTKITSTSPAITGTMTAEAAMFSADVDITGALAVDGVTTFNNYATIATEAAGSANTRLATTEFVATAVVSAAGGASRMEMLFYAGF